MLFFKKERKKAMTLGIKDKGGIPKKVVGIFGKNKKIVIND